MRRSLQEYVELVVFGLIAVLVGTGLLWVLGWALSLGGIVLKGLAGLLWMLLRFIVPVAIAGGLVYFLVKAAQGRQRQQADAGTGAPASVATPNPSYTPPMSPVDSGMAAAGGAGAVGAARPATPGYEPGGSVNSAADRAAAEAVADFDEAGPGFGVDPLGDAADPFSDNVSGPVGETRGDDPLDPATEAATDETLGDERDEA